MMRFLLLALFVLSSTNLFADYPGSTYFGGSNMDKIIDMKVDSQGFIYIVGQSDSDDIPLVTPYQPAPAGGQEVFIAKLDPKAENIIFSTYFGGTGHDHVLGMDLDQNDNIYIYGYTYSTDLPVSVGTYKDANAGDADGFLAKFSNTGTQLLYSTYIGGAEYDQIDDIAIDGDKCYFIGKTYSQNLYTSPNALYKNFIGSRDAYFGALDLTTSIPYFACYFGTSEIDEPKIIEITPDGQVFIAGTSNGDQLPVTAANAFSDTRFGESDIFFSIFNSNASLLRYSTYMGSTNVDNITDVHFVAKDSLIILGTTTDDSFPFTNTVHLNNGVQGTDAFIMSLKIDTNLTKIHYCTGFGDTGEINPTDMYVDEYQNVLVSGGTNTNKFKTTDGAYDPHGDAAAQDAFMVRFNYKGDNLIYSTYLGENGVFDNANAVHLVDQNTAIIAGETQTSNFSFDNAAAQDVHAGANDGLIFRMEGIEFPLIDIYSFPEIVCKTDSISMFYYLNILFEDTNVFEVQLSDENGSFSNPTVIFSQELNTEEELRFAIPESVNPSENYLLRMTSSNPPYTSPVYSTAFLIANKPDTTITGDREVCYNTTTKFACIAEDDVTNTWEVTGGQIESSNSGDSITVYWGSVGKGTILLRRENTETSCYNEIEIDIDIHSVPDATIVGEYYACCGIPIEYSTQVYDTRDTYKWDITNGTIVSMEENRVHIKWDCEAESGIINLEINRSESICEASNEMQVQIKGAPEVTFQMQTEFCRNDEEITLSGGTPEGGEYTASQGVKDGKFNPKNAKDETWIYYTYHNGECPGTDSVLVTVHPYPPKPSIKREGSELVSSADEGNQWYKDGSLIADATDKRLTITEIGDYTVQVTNEFGCDSDMSSVYKVDNSVEDLISDNLKIYPNPVSDKLNIEISDKLSAKKIEIRNILGEKVVELPINSLKFEISELNKYPAGVYFIDIITSSGKITKKVIFK